MENETAPSWALELIKSQTLMVEAISALSGKVTKLETETNSIKNGIKDVVPEKYEEASQEEIDKILEYMRLV